MRANFVLPFASYIMNALLLMRMSLHMVSEAIHVGRIRPRQFGWTSKAVNRTMRGYLKRLSPDS